MSMLFGVIVAVDQPLSPPGFSVSPQAVRVNADTIANVNVSRTIKNFLFILSSP